MKILFEKEIRGNARSHAAELQRLIGEYNTDFDKRAEIAYGLAESLCRLQACSTEVPSCYDKIQDILIAHGIPHKRYVIIQDNNGFRINTEFWKPSHRTVAQMNEEEIRQGLDFEY